MWSQDNFPHHWRCQEEHTLAQDVKGDSSFKEDFLTRNKFRGASGDSFLACQSQERWRLCGIRARHSHSCRKLSSAVSRLQRAVAAIPREWRRAALQRLSHRVRAVLLSYMESCTLLRSCGVQQGQCIGQADPRKGAPSSSIERVSKAIPPAISQTVATTATIANAVPDVRSVHAKESLRHNAAYPGVSHVGKHRYRAHAFFANIRCMTVCVPELDKARKFQLVLSEVKRAVAQASEAELLASSIQQALLSACMARGLDAQDMKLAFRAEVSARRIINRDVWGRYSLDLTQALADRQVLLAGREGGWPTLRAAWIAALQMPVLVREGSPYGWARHPQLDAEMAAGIADAAWISSRKAKERGLVRCSSRHSRKRLQDASLCTQSTKKRLKKSLVGKRIRQCPHSAQGASCTEDATDVVGDSGRHSMGKPSAGRRHKAKCAEQYRDLQERAMLKAAKAVERAMDVEERRASRYLLATSHRTRKQTPK